MPAKTINLETRISILNAAVTKKDQREVVEKEFKEADGDWQTALASLEKKLPPDSLKKVTLAYLLAEWSDDDLSIIKALVKQPAVINLRDVALRFNVEKLAELIDPQTVPETIAGIMPDEKKRNFAIKLQHKLFTTEPTAVLQRMVEEAEIPIADPRLRTSITSFLNNQPDFNIRTTSIYTILKQPEAFKDIAEEQRTDVVEQLKTIQRTVAISPNQESIPVLMKANLTSAFQVAEMPESTFLRAHSKTLGEETARQVYTNAINTRIRNEQALITMREAMRGTGLAIIDGQESLEERIVRLQETTNEQAVPLNLETLFGGIDYCECDDCVSVCSPASYFVELLQFLRNNNLGPNPADPNGTNPNIHPGIINTPLEKLFRRRPDLGCLELTCENTFTVLPYIDLVNEVMESFVVHLKDYQADNHDPKQAILEAFNVDDETSSELLAEPQHTNYQAYCILKNAVYPCTLPFHQALTAIRIFLNYLNTSRYEVLDTYRTAHEVCPDVILTPEEQKELQVLHQTVLDRSVDAEFLGLIQEEYIILTKEAFWPKHYFEITLKKDIEDKDYRTNIGVKCVYEYYGYDNPNDMFDTNNGLGLTFVKKQFLPRTGIQYADLVELLKTQFINPNYPQGKALKILESIRFSYKFLKSLVDPDTSKSRQERFSKLIDFLKKTQPLIPQIEDVLHPDPCKQQKPDHCLEISGKDLENWVYCYFDRIGQLIVLESEEGPQLPIEGPIYTAEETVIGTLYKDGNIVDIDLKTVIGHVDVTIEAGKSGVLFALAGPVVTVNNESFVKKYGNGDSLSIIDKNGGPAARIDFGDGMLYWALAQLPVQIHWLPIQDTCNLEKVRLTHLDGTPITIDEYDCIHRFIRLWRKMGWSMDEADKALMGLAASPIDPDSGGIPGTPDQCDYVNFNVFKDECPPGGGDNGSCDNGDGPGDNGSCPDVSLNSCDITPNFLHQLVAVRKVLNLTGLPISKLLTFWADISTVGEKPLYARLFLTHNLLGIDKVFQADTNGNYLTESAKITDHIPVIMAALNLKADDITEIMNFRQLPDALTLPSVSVLYRHSLLAKVLHIRIVDLFEVIALLGDPFESAWSALTLLETWSQMEDAGFTFRQLNYLIRNHDDPLHPLAPSQRILLQLTKTLYDGLNAIDHEHPDLKQSEEATAELIRAKAGLLFEQTKAEQILGLLEGTTVYTTNAPTNLAIEIPNELGKKIKYISQKDSVPSRAAIQVTGILTDNEKSQAKALSNHPDWAEAIDRVGKQALNFFNDVLFGIFSKNKDDAIENLLAGDINIPPDPQNPDATDANTATAKRCYFLQHFMPFLRQRLTHRFIVDTLAGAASLTSDITDVLLSDILTVGTPPKPAMSVLESIIKNPAPSGSDWRGYLIPSADDLYVFISESLVGDAQPAPIVIDGQSIPFTCQQEDPSDVWSTDPEHPVPLKSGKLYLLEVKGQSAEQLQWKTATSPQAPITASALLPDYASQGTKDVFTKFYKTGLLINGFNLSIDEISYWQIHGINFDNFDFNNIELQHWRRLQAYTDLRNNLPKLATTLLDLFKWAEQPDDVLKLSDKIEAATGWKKESIEKLIKAEHFDLDCPDAFRNEASLVKLRKAVAVADKIGVDIDRLFEWAQPGTKFWVCHQIAEDIRKAVRARFDQEDWEQVVKPLNDQLREHQKQALISYLLVQQELIEWGVVDADSLFEFFLIDVQMDACMETSRIKQAISSVQLFVQRCFLGLEDQYGVPSGVLDRDRWNWMQRYRIWEANRKVFLYPENWIEPQLRDDKSSFYEELESEILQKDINPQTVQDALKNYLFKVDEVANLKVVGLFVEQETDSEGKEVPVKLHVFSRKRIAPYYFYYRYFHIQEKNWYAWERVQVDIPSYDAEDNNGRIAENGTYLIPVVWNNRQLLFCPQFMKKTVSKSIQKKDDNGNSREKTFQEIGAENTPTNIKPIEYWEIKMGWSERQNRKWTQKQVSSDAIPDSKNPLPDTLPDIRFYEFIPRLVTSNNTNFVVIDVYHTEDLIEAQAQLPIGAFYFAGNQLFREAYSGKATSPTDFHYQKDTIYSLQAIGQETPPLFGEAPYFVDEKTDNNTRVVKIHYKKEDTTGSNFYHPFAHELLGTLTTGNLDALFDYYLTKVSDTSEAYGADDKAIYNELKRTYSIYNWEAAFHAPMQLVDRLLKTQQFEQALKMCHYVFNPLAKGNDDKRFWQFPPFKEIDAKNVLEKLFLGLQPGQPNDQINEWRNKPFQPHVVARGRPVAYMKWVVMKYLEILIAWGDYLFRQDTIEAINQATQLYVLAAHIYGQRGQKIPKLGKIKPQTYISLLDKWDAFSNAMVELELVFPYSNQTPPIGVNNSIVELANIFGFATTLYFCIPDNPQLRALRDTIDDRLFKIRHCQNIEGVFRTLPLFEPPIEPGLLVQAAAQGLSLASVLNDLNSPMPNYRFYYLLQKALELCSEVKALGNAFLTAKEKGDAEALSRLRAKHESSIQNLMMEVRKHQLDEANEALHALEQSRKGPEYRLRHYLNLIGEDINKVPSADTDFAELPDQNEPIIDESGFKLIAFEKEAMDKASEAHDRQIAIGVVETLASILHAIPLIATDVKPIGVGVGLSLGGSNFGNATQAIARQIQIDAANLTHQASSAERKAGLLRQLQDRIQQANIAGYEIKNIDKQILTQNIRISIAGQEVDTQQKQIDNAQEVEEFLRNKYTNEELYSWIEGQTRTLYHQAYTLAYDLAKKAEKAFLFERGTTSSFIEIGYWDASYDGLLAGERLYFGLKQLEAAYQEKRGYDFEIFKPVSLRQLDPQALLQLKDTGSCEFTLPEVLFDMDHPGHYMRRIKSLALTIPCVVGPYTSLNCTLRLLKHRFRINAIVNGKNDYPEKIDITDDRFSTISVPITGIAVSTGQNDSGMFELNFRDERYLPFEGAGVISTWRLELPDKFRQFDYDTIADVVIQLRYTAVDGGDKLKIPASDSVQDYIKSVEQLSDKEGLFAIFDLKHDFPNEWHKATHSPADATERILMLDNLYERLPIFTKGRPLDKIQAKDVYLFTPSNLKDQDLLLIQGNDVQGFKSGPILGETLKSFSIKGMNNFSVNSWKLKISDVDTELDKLWLLIRYVLT